MSRKYEHNKIQLTYDEAVASTRPDDWMETMKSANGYLHWKMKSVKPDHCAWISGEKMFPQEVYAPVAKMPTIN